MKNREQWKVVFMAVFAIIPLVLIACGPTVPTNTHTSLPTIAPFSQPETIRPHLLIQYCDDDTGSYPHKYFPQANQLIADSLQDAVTANQQGVTLFATAITHDTFDPKNTLDPAFVIPSIPAYEMPPTPVPTFAPENPVFDNATATAVRSQTVNGIIAYNGRVAVIKQQIASTKSAIKQDVGRLNSWNPPVDTTATSVLGCFQLAATRFQTQSGVKMIYIASDLENNTDVDYTQNFAKTHALSGAIVHVIFFVSANASRDQEKRARWCAYLKSSGASTILFSDPAAPLHDVFDTDLTASASAC
jgi:hypothetical protein